MHILPSPIVNHITRNGALSVGRSASLKSFSRRSERPDIMTRAHASLDQFQLTPNTRLVLSQGDLTTFSGDAIVNAGVHRTPTSDFFQVELLVQKDDEIFLRSSVILFAHIPVVCLGWGPGSSKIPWTSCAAAPALLGGGGVDGGELPCIASLYITLRIVIAELHSGTPLVVIALMNQYQVVLKSCCCELVLFDVQPSTMQLGPSFWKLAGVCRWCKGAVFGVQQGKRISLRERAFPTCMLPSI